MTAARPVRLILPQPYTKRLAEYVMYRNGKVYERKKTGTEKLVTNPFIIAAAHAKVRQKIGKLRRWGWLYRGVDAVLTHVARWKFEREYAAEAKARKIAHAIELNDKLQAAK